MAVKTVYLSKAGRVSHISPHFVLMEMASKDGSDKVLYSTELMAMLEKLRDYGGFTVHINSGYRSPSYNRRIGGASKSQHTQGTAADIAVRKDGKTVSSKLICCLCQTLGFKGIAYISESAVHVDMRESGSYRGDERKGYSGNVGGDFYRYFGIRKSEVDALKKKENPKKDFAKEGKREKQESRPRQEARPKKENRPKPEPRTEFRAEAKADSKPEVKPETKPEVKPEQEKKSSDAPKKNIDSAACEKAAKDFLTQVFGAMGMEVTLDTVYDEAEKQLTV
ncbi:MAG: D-Ala-D-Ala carboxypeptidase family metallohydrolase, partial [Clostridia bacterium]